MLTVGFEVDILQGFVCVHRNLKESYNNITINTVTNTNNNNNNMCNLIWNLQWI